MSAVDKCVRDDILDPNGAPVGGHSSLGLGCLIFNTIFLPRTICLVVPFILGSRHWPKVDRVEFVPFEMP